MALIVLFWTAFAPFAMWIGIPIACFFTIKNAWTAGAYLTSKQIFSPFIKLFTFPCRFLEKHYNKTLTNIVAVLGIVFYSLAALCSLGVIWLPLPDMYLFPGSVLMSIIYVLSVLSLFMIITDYNHENQSFYFIPKSRLQFRDSLRRYVDSNPKFSLDWSTSDYEINQFWHKGTTDTAFLDVSDFFYYLSFYSNYEDDLVSQAWIELDYDASPNDIFTLVPVLLRSFDNSATDKKVSKLTADLAAHITPGFGIVLPGYSVGFVNIEDKFSLIVRLN